MSKEKPKTTKCILCNNHFVGVGHNPAPLEDSKFRCCDGCNSARVVPYRVYKLREQRKQNANPDAIAIYQCSVTFDNEEWFKIPLERFIELTEGRGYYKKDSALEALIGAKRIRTPWAYFKYEKL